MTTKIQFFYRHERDCHKYITFLLREDRIEPVNVSKTGSEGNRPSFKDEVTKETLSTVNHCLTSE